MQSKNKSAPTVAERAHIARVAALPCIVCGAEPVEVHEPEQGLWFAAVPLCSVCHRDSQRGWHGARGNWYAVKMTELKAINATVKLLMGNT